MVLTFARNRAAPGPASGTLKRGEHLQAARRAARERYRIVAELLKAEAGVTTHFLFKQLGGLAWLGTGRILAPRGITRRQLYVLAHECGHIILHSDEKGRAKPSHVKEHEAETYAHRALARYGIEVPERSALWARAYVGLWIMKDKQDGFPISAEAHEFARGRRSPYDPLPAVDGKPSRDFSRQMEKFVARGTRTAEAQEKAAAELDAGSIVAILKGPASESDREVRRLRSQLLARGRRLARRGVVGAHAAVAAAIDAADRNTRSGQQVLPALLRGLDQLETLARDQRAARWQRFRAAASGRESAGFAGFFLAAALICGAFAINSHDSILVSASLACFGVAFVCSLGLVWDYWTTR